MPVMAQNWPSMKFSCGIKDTLYIGITQEDDITELTLVCSAGHKHPEWKSITIGFENGEELVIYNNGRYLILEDYLLRHEPFSYILFNKNKSSTGCLNIKTKDYFIKYFQSVKN